MNNSAESICRSVDDQETLDLDEELLLALDSEEVAVPHTAIGPSSKAQVCTIYNVLGFLETFHPFDLRN